jgi:hypothetical protein
MITADDRLRLDAQLARWRDDLVDLARTNRLVNFRHTKTATLEIIAPAPRDILNGLAGRAGGWYFAHQTAESVREADVLEEDAILDDTDLPRAEPPSGHLLTTKPDARALDSSLRTLERRASQEYLDKGIWILYLGLGMLHWQDRDGQALESPLLLVPVRIGRASISSPFRLDATDEDMVVNPALALKLARDFGVSLPAFENGAEDDPTSIIEGIRALVANREDWEVCDRAVLATFAFLKQAMYEDLLENADAVAEHPLVRVLALGPEAAFALPNDPSPVPEDRLDELAPPELMVSIRDADASQRRCIVAAVAGASFVMDGPPGTGKSQTIANMIAELLAAEKSVLFVSEKAAALEVVQKRLAEAHLDDYVLELHSHKATRKEVALQLAKSLTSHPQAGATLTSTQLHQLESRRHELSAYAAALNEMRQPLGRTLHQALGRLAALQELPPPPAIELAQSLSAALFQRMLDLGEELGRAWGPVSRRDAFVWRDLRDPDALAGQTMLVARQLSEASSALDTLIDAADAVASDLHLSRAHRLADVERIHGLLELLSSRPAGVSAAWLAAPEAEPIAERLEALEDLCERHDRRAREMAELLGPGWEHLDPASPEFQCSSDSAARQSGRRFGDQSNLGG